MMDKVPNKLGAEYYRSFLSEQGKQIYDGLLKTFASGDYSGKYEFQVRDESTVVDDTFRATRMLREDHPEIFFIERRSISVHGKTATLTYSLLFRKEFITFINNHLEKEISRIVRGTQNLPMPYAERVVYQRIAKLIAYEDHDDQKDHSVVGPVLTKTGVCEGKNALLLLCLRRIGIPCIKVNSKHHCWTIAWINETPVHLDVTWERFDDRTGYCFFAYFNLSDALISEESEGDSHSPEKDVSIPACGTESLTYFAFNGKRIDSHAQLRKAMEEQREGSCIFQISYLPEEKVISETRTALAECGRAGYITSYKRNVIVSIL